MEKDDTRKEWHLTNLEAKVGKALSCHFSGGESFAKLGSAAETNDADIFECKERRRESPGNEMLTLGFCDLERVSIWFLSTPSRREMEGTKKARMDRARRDDRARDQLFPFLSLLAISPPIYGYCNGIRGASCAKSPLLTLR